MTAEEDRLALRFCDREFAGQETVRKLNFRIIDDGEGCRERRVDALLAEGSEPIDDGDLRCLHGRKITIIQAKVTPLNAWLIGQALLSPRLLARTARKQGWEPAEIRSVALCDVQRSVEPIGPRCTLSDLIESRFTSKDLELVTLEVPDKDKKERDSIERIRGVAALYASQVTENGCLIKNPRMPAGLKVSGILIHGLSSSACRRAGDWDRLVVDRRVTVIHSEQVTHQHENQRKREPAMSAMYMAGEIIAAQLLLTRCLGAASAESIVGCESIDQNVAEELAAYDVSFRAWDVTQPGLEGLGPVLGHAAQPARLSRVSLPRCGGALCSWTPGLA